MSTRLLFWSLAMFAMGMILSPLARYPVPFVEKPVLVIDRVTKKLCIQEIWAISKGIRPTAGGLMKTLHQPNATQSLSEEKQPR